MNGPFLTERAMINLSCRDDERLTCPWSSALSPWPRRAGMPTARGAPFAATHRWLDRLHGHAAVVAAKPIQRIRPALPN